MELAVYFDGRYASSWIDGEWCIKITECLESRDFVRRNAEELKKWIREGLKRVRSEGPLLESVFGY